MEIIYDKNNRPLEISNFKYYDEGSCAKIFKENNTMLKIYKSNCTYKYYLSKKMLLVSHVLSPLKIFRLSSIYIILKMADEDCPVDLGTATERLRKYQNLSASRNVLIELGVVHHGLFQYFGSGV